MNGMISSIYSPCGKLDAHRRAIASAKLASLGPRPDEISRRRARSIQQGGGAMTFDPTSALGWAWLVFLGYWIFARFSVNRMARPEPAGTMFFRIVIMAGAAWLLFTPDPRFGILN